MTITFPREMLCGVQQVEFSPRRFMFGNQLRGGQTQVGEAAETRWSANFTYTKLKPVDQYALEAWLDSLRGGFRDFLAHDPLKPYPLLYPGGPSLTRSGGGAFDWTATVPTVDPTNSVLGIGSGSGKLPAAFSVVPGDMVGLVEAGKYGLFRIVEAASASGAGNIGITVEPRIIPGLFTTAAVANFKRPACLMTLDSGSVSAVRSTMALSSVSFSGIQKVF